MPDDITVMIVAGTCILVGYVLGAMHVLLVHRLVARRDREG